MDLVRLKEVLTKEPLERSRDDLRLLLPLLRNTTPFKDQPEDVVLDGCKVCSIVSFPVDTIVFRHGAIGDSFFVILDGGVQVINEDTSAVVATLEEGRCFGEIALATNQMRSATIRTTSPSQFLTLSKRNYDRVLKGIQNEECMLTAHLILKVTEVCSKSVGDRTDTDVETIMPLLLGVKDFSFHAKQVLHQVARAVGYMKFEGGDIVFHKGEEGKVFFIILHGTVEVLDEREKCLAILSSGETFGERALEKNEPRAATIRCSTPCHLLTLTKDAYTRVLEHKHLHDGLLCNSRNVSEGVAAKVRDIFKFRMGADEGPPLPTGRKAWRGANSSAPHPAPEVTSPTGAANNGANHHLVDPHLEEIEELKRRLRACEADNVHVRGIVTELEAQLAAQRQRLADEERESANRERLAAEAVAKAREHAEAQLREEHERLTQLQAALEEARKREAEEKAMLTRSANETSASLEIQLQAAQEQVQLERARCASLASELLQRDTERMEQAAESAKETDKWRAKYQKVYKAAKRGMAEVTSEKAKVKDLSEQLKTALQERDDARRNTGRVQEELEGLMQERAKVAAAHKEVVVDLETSLEEAIGEIDRRDAALGDAAAANEQLKRENAEIVRGCERHLQEALMMQETIANLQAQLARWQDEHGAEVDLKQLIYDATKHQLAAQEVRHSSLHAKELLLRRQALEALDAVSLQLNDVSLELAATKKEKGITTPTTTAATCVESPAMRRKRIAAASLGISSSSSNNINNITTGSINYNNNSNGSIGAGAGGEGVAARGRWK